MRKICTFESVNFWWKIVKFRCTQYRSLILAIYHNFYVNSDFDSVGKGNAVNLYFNLYFFYGVLLLEKITISKY